MDITQESLTAALNSAVPDGASFNVGLGDISRWRIGGNALAVIEPRTSREISDVVIAMRDRDEPLQILGETSNVLFDDDGFGGVLMRIGAQMSRFEIKGNRLRSQAGASVPVLAKAAAAAGLQGMEHACGIPGTIGGLVFMNGGSQRKGIGEIVREIVCVTEHGDVVVLTNDDLRFEYRSSSLQYQNMIVTEVELELEPGNVEEIASVMDQILAERAAKFPLDLPNCGSTFLSDPAMYSAIGPPGKVIADLGFKGLTRNGAQVSNRHANFIVNRGGATARDVLWLIALIRSEVHRRTGYLMMCEVRFLSSLGSMRPAHEVALEVWPERLLRGGE